ncbi:hypothetical protein [Flammeovirga kamogawensis]|uniref:Uncharacterized protein n=1 Tax=Flammeovirga kamogawensis TaxID=373891 RepID=A0ABX8GVL6_9BACT|nr:hypothetical protein [Flammeovirga kamogawensis]MBB6459749.1 hypothetical protein [Flammeovirga kamogawensis]QWG07192.1 hypothetical protein KM029_18100 [Flammeovirga kamogawensis]TRX69012.1 hypothetical protein EO216_13090 [Flammeovirga kamogawensis]
MKKNQENQNQEIDWDALEAEDKANELDSEEKVDHEKINEEKKKLSKEEQYSPYPDDFLAEINIIRKNYDNEVKNEEIDQNNLEE